MKGTKFSNKNTYVNVVCGDSVVDSPSDEKSDHLSYSYSCVKSFRENQHVIRDLTALRNHQEYQGITHEPALYSLSGERNKPICQPFLCAIVSENSDPTEENCTSDSCRKQVVEKKENLTSSESQQQFPVKDLLLQWLKEQFKQVNSLWSFALSKDIFIPKLCKNKNQKMKMEMTLNSVDEETKHKLINYINKLNLGYEEHCNFCTGNETVLEIDVTSIMDDPERLQRLLTFLKGIESKNSQVLRRNVPSDVNEHVDNKCTLEKNVTRKKYLIKERVDSSEKCEEANGLEKHTYQSYSPSTGSNESFLLKQKIGNPKEDKKDKVCGEVKITQSQCKHCGIEKDIKNNEGIRIMLSKCEKIKNKEVPQGEKRSRQISTLSGRNCVENVLKPNRICENSKYQDSRKVHFEQNISNVQTNCEHSEPQFLKQVDRKLSCKCLMHNNREDYYRYKNVCLFGKGDEINNSFIKYVNQSEKKSESSIYFTEKNFNFALNDNVGGKNLDLSAVFGTKQMPADKTVFQNESKDKYTENVKEKTRKDKDINHKTFFNSPQKSSLEENLNPQVQRIDCFHECFSVKTDTDRLTSGNNCKPVAVNSYFKSLNFCLDSLSNMNNSDRLSAEDNVQSKINQKHCLSSNNHCRKLYEEGIHEFNKSFVSNKKCNIEDEGVKPHSLKNSKNYNIGFGIEHNLGLPANVSVLNENALKKESYLKDVMCNVKNFMTNQREKQKFNSNRSNIIVGRDSQYFKKQQSLTEITGVFDNHKIFKESDSDLLSEDKNKIYSPNNKKECCVFGCDCKTSKQKSAKIKTIVFKIGASNKEVKIRSGRLSKKFTSKLTLFKAKEVHKSNISSVFKGSELVNRAAEFPVKAWNDVSTDKSTDYSSTEQKSVSNKSGRISNSWVDCSSFTDSPTSRSRGTPQTWAQDSGMSNDLGILLSEVKNQRMEIDCMKKMIKDYVHN